MTATTIELGQLSTVLDGLWNGKPSVEEISTPTAITGPKVLATYNDAAGNLRFAIECELPLANSLGAALTLLPPGVAKGATAAGNVPENIAENLHEVLNICSSLFVSVDHHRIVLDQVFLPGQELGSDTLDALSSSKTLLQANYGIDRYQPGLISLLAIE